ncbi:MAG TPA: hypothetical protein VHJ20_12275 [Polyangia bacterium]|nr:hypothetical protein [Polyangia bacterium]
MRKSKVVLGMVLGAAGGFAAGVVARSARADGAAAPAAAAITCKAHDGKKCCDPAVTAHLPLSAVFSACGESDATFAGEEGSKETCKYVFKVPGQKEDETFVQVYAPAQKEVPAAPADPFFVWKKLGKAFVTERATSPKSAPMLASATGLWLPGKGYFVSVNASTKVCEKAQAKKLASSLK